MHIENTPAPPTVDLAAPQTRAADASPDLRMYHAMHSAIRTSNERLVVGLSDLRRSARHASAPALQRWFDGYRTELRGHHGIEDSIFFPALAERIPSFSDYSTILDADHHRLDTVVDEITVSLTALASAAAAWDAEHEVAVARAVELRDLMSEHLDYEDREILPMFERHFSAEEYRAMDDQARRSVSMKHALFFVPWLMSSLPSDVAAAALAEAPTPLKLIHRATKRRYERLTLDTFGSATLALTVGERP